MFRDGPHRRLAAWIAAPAAAALLAPAAALAQPPANDRADAAAFFQPVTAENGTPRDLQGIADLAEATPDAGVPRCLGRGSFQRTVWFRVPAAPTQQEITVDASGRTLDVVDLAAFVQPQGATAPLTSIPNACAGSDSGGADAAQEPTSAVSLRVPPFRDVLIQVGRHGPRRSPDDERVLLALEADQLSPRTPPDGDRAEFDTHSVHARGSTFVDLFGATIGEEDPAQPPCPSLGSVWRRLVPKRPGTAVISVYGSQVGTFTIFAGKHPTPYNALDCVDRSGYGAMQMRVALRRGRPLWLRLGTDRPTADAQGEIRVHDGTNRTVVDGGSGGFDPTPGGPAGGLPLACDHVEIARARIRGARLRGTVKVLNKRPALALKLRITGSPACDAELELRGPHGRVYATDRDTLLKGRKTVRMRRTRRLAKGVYRLRVTALSELGDRVPVRTSVSGRLK